MLSSASCIRIGLVVEFLGLTLIGLDILLKPHTLEKTHSNLAARLSRNEAKAGKWILSFDLARTIRKMKLDRFPSSFAELLKRMVIFFKVRSLRISIILIRITAKLTSEIRYLRLFGYAIATLGFVIIFLSTYFPHQPNSIFTIIIQ